MFAHIGILAAALLAQAGPSRIQWKSFSPPNGNFRTLTPGEPKEGRAVLKTVDGEVDARVYPVTGGDTAYVVTYYDRPVTAPKATPEEIVEAARERLRAELQAKVTKLSRLEINGKKGAEILMDAPVANSKLRMDVRARIFVVERRVFELKSLAYQKPKGIKPTDTNPFFKSFRIAGSSEAATVTSEEEIPAENETIAAAKKAKGTEMAKADAKSAKPKPEGTAKTEGSKPKAAQGGAEVASGGKSISKGIRGLFGSLSGPKKNDAAGGSAPGGLFGGNPLAGLMGAKPPGLPGAAPPGAQRAPGSGPKISQADLPAGFKPFHSNENGFSIYFPGDPEQFSLDLAAPQHLVAQGAPASLKVGGLRQKSGAIAYSVLVVKQQDKVVLEASEDFYKGFLDSYIKEGNGTLDSQSSISYCTLPALEFKYHFTEKAANLALTGRVRVVVANKTAYIVIVFSPNVADLDAQNAFFESFAIDGVGGGLAPPTAASGAVASAAIPPEFKPYFSAKLHFGVLMPGEVKSTSKDVGSPVQRVIGGSAMLKTALVSHQKGKVTYSVRVISLPRAVPEGKVDALLKASMRIALEGGKGTVLSEKETKLEEHAGRDFLQEVTRPGSKDPVFVHSRIFLKGERLYLVMVAAPDRAAAESGNNFYLDSFKFQEKPDEAGETAGAGGPGAPAGLGGSGSPGPMAAPGGGRRSSPGAVAAPKGGGAPSQGVQ